MKTLAWFLALSVAPAALSAEVPRVKVTDQLIMNEQNVDVGLAVQIGNKRMTLNAPHLGPVSAPGLPSVLPARDARDRDESIRATGGATFARLGYSKRDYLARISLGEGLQLELTDPENGKVTESLKDPSGGVLHAGVASGMLDRSGREMGLSLDVVAAELGLGADWPQQVTFSLSENGRVTTVTDRAGNALLYVLNYGTVRAGYLPNGKALFYDLPLATAASPRSSHMDADLGDSPMGFMSGVAMERIQITANGGVCAYLPRASAGAIMSFWVARDAKGRPVYGFRTADPAGNAQVQSAPSPPSAPEHGDRRRLRPVEPESFYNCGSETACSYCDFCGADGGPGSDCTTTQYVCWSDDGGGGGGGGAGGGGGSGGVTPGNHVTGDTVLSAHVNLALTNAQSKLQNLSSNCVQQILGLSDGNGHTLGQNLGGMPNGPWTPYTYMTQVLGYVNGYTTGQCSSANAWMAGVFQTQVNVCTSFSNLSTGMAGNALIHEFLHSIGLPELPTYPSATMTSADITQFVTNACGAN